MVTIMKTLDDTMLGATLRWTSSPSRGEGVLVHHRKKVVVVVVVGVNLFHQRYRIGTMGAPDLYILIYTSTSKWLEVWDKTKWWHQIQDNETLQSDSPLVQERFLQSEWSSENSACFSEFLAPQFPSKS